MLIKVFKQLSPYRSKKWNDVVILVKNEQNGWVPWKVAPQVPIPLQSLDPSVTLSGLAYVNMRLCPPLCLPSEPIHTLNGPLNTWSMIVKSYWATSRIYLSFQEMTYRPSCSTKFLHSGVHHPETLPGHFIGSLHAPGLRQSLETCDPHLWCNHSTP